MIFCAGARDQWHPMLGVAQVPAGVGKLVVLLSAGGQASPQDAAWFDDVELYRLD